MSVEGKLSLFLHEMSQLVDRAHEVQNTIRRDAPKNTALAAQMVLAIEALQTAGDEFQEIIEESNQALVQQDKHAQELQQHIMLLNEQNDELRSELKASLAANRSLRRYNARLIGQSIQLQHRIGHLCTVLEEQQRRKKKDTAEARRRMWKLTEPEQAILPIKEVDLEKPVKRRRHRKLQPEPAIEEEQTSTALPEFWKE